MALVFRSVSDYKLVAKLGTLTECFNSIMGLPELWRLSPQSVIPEGFKEVTKLNGIKVHDEEGKLSPKFWGIKRMTIRSSI